MHRSFDFVLDSAFAQDDKWVKVIDDRGIESLKIVEVKTVHRSFDFALDSAFAQDDKTGNVLVKLSS